MTGNEAGMQDRRAVMVLYYCRLQCTGVHLGHHRMYLWTSFGTPLKPHEYGIIFFINQQSNELLPPTSTGNTVKANGLNEQQRPAQHEPSTGPLQFYCYLCLCGSVIYWTLETGPVTSAMRAGVASHGNARLRPFLVQKFSRSPSQWIHVWSIKYR
jgi:hypothetical protein